MNNQNHKERSKQPETFEEWSWVPFDGWKGLHYAKYASDILNYRPLFGKELNSTKILILIKLWENKTRENTTYHTEEILGRATGVDRRLVGKYINEMCQSELECSICGEKFGIMEIIGKHKYDSGKSGYLYSLEKIELLLIHLTKHNRANPDKFYKYLESIEKPIKANITKKQLSNLKRTEKKKKADF